MNNPQQRKSLDKVCKRRPFKQCWCGSWDTYESYEPEWMGWEVWCYTCGRKDAQVTKRPIQENEGKVGVEVDNEQEFKNYLAGLTLQQRRDLLLQIKIGKG